MNPATHLRLIARALAAAVMALFAAAPSVAADASDAHGPSWGLHGMLLFGGADGIYASHLPMFHAPHDRQVVLKLKFADPKLDSRLRRDLGSKPAVWTLVPEKFELERLAPDSAQPLRAFKADVAQGHFERNGVTRHKNALVQVMSVEVFKPLDPAAKPGLEATYLPIGSGKTWFLVKDLSARPDFDHVVAVNGPQQPKPVVLPVNGVKQPSDADLRRGLPPEDKLLGTVYFDIEDLK